MKNKLARLPQQLLACIALAMLLATGMQTARAAGSDANSVETLDYSTLEGGKLLIKVGLKQTLRASPAGFTINNPPRVVLDLAGAANGLGKNTVNVNQGPLRSINIVQAGDRTRLVMNLSKAAQYTTRIDGNALLITLQESDSQTTSNVTPRFAEGAPSAAKHSVRDIDFHRGASGEGRIVTTLSDTTTGIDIRKQGQQLVVDFLNTDVPRSLQRRLDVNDFATPVKYIETQGSGSNVRMTVEPKGDYEYSAYQADNQFTIEVRAKPEDTGKAAAGKPKYTGEKLSLNFQNVEVRSVLQVIADFTGLNIITSDTVNGNLTLRLKDVPWDQALDIIMQSKGLDKRVNGNVIWVAPKDELIAKEKSELESRQATQALEPLVVRSYVLDYMRADQAARVLQGLAATSGDNGEDVTCSAQAQGVKATPVATTAAPISAAPGSLGTLTRILSARGSASSEPQTNSLIVSDTPSKQDEVRELLKLIDIPAKQVMIEARVVVADDGFSRQLGARFGVQHGRKNDSVGFSNTAANAANGIVSGVNGAAPFNVDLPVSGAAGTLGLSLINLGSGNLVSLELSALEADNRGKIISNPRVVTSNQRPAVILQGTQIPYITPGTANSPATVTFKDAFLCLLVNPQILNNDSVILNVEVQKDAVGASTAGNPAINTKRVKTQIRLKNGETAVLGGIFEQSTRNDTNKVPLLGDIPIFGNLFKDNSRVDQKTELLIFLTPRIIKDNLELH
ncbi:pilus assembly protein PilQ [Sulfuriferula plumbiphila]|uniref:Type IV pilus biogenesis and competence protein PilQ n=1 Tax=Sulfuriferula plumbiphila TaxID=171865 RepID=A0A512L843_9PROT|nr:type IV pilus secretin family protein [Sulfuriferula plumbiphila]BBP05645.1 pilus assembly protein PilQ [Sulfuriferula plumbiphila]GEP30648.1 pilus assembly protein PilQ [Sulfuriferula plumbiphila]